MFSLTEEQIAFIENDIKIRGITSPDLSIDLLDHICCLIEDKLDEYRSFEDVYQETILLFGEKGLKEIQLETNRLLTFKHYYIMNATMKISGYISSLMILAGAIFKFNHWPGANVMLVTGVFFFTVLFLPLLFILKFRSSAENNRSIMLSIIAFISSLAISSGILFRIMHWPNARILIVTGCALLVLGYLPVYFISVYKNNTNKINATATIILIIAGVGLFITESGTGLTKQVSDSFWKGIIENNELISFIEKNNMSVYDKIYASKDSTYSTSSFKKLQNATIELTDHVHKLKTHLIAATENLTEVQAASLEIDALRTSGGGEIAETILFNDNDRKYSAAALKEKINSYKDLILSIDSKADVSKLNTEKVIVYGEENTWEKANFEKLPIPLIVYNLIKIELAIRTTESALLNQLQ